MEKNIRLSLLLDFYGSMLTDKKREIMTLYVELDTSLSEIATELNTTRQSVYDAVKVSMNDLENFEKKLKCVEKYISNREIILESINLLKENFGDNETTREVIKKLEQVLKNQ